MLKGIDIGGSFIKVLWDDGTKEKHYIKDIKGDRRKLLEKIKEVALSGNPEAVGVAVAGFTSVDGTVTTSPNLPQLNGVNIEELLRGVKVKVGNDVTLGAFGEWFFDHREAKVLALVSVGTGLGSGLVVEGKPFFGACGSAMEFGHHIISEGGWLCNCGRKGCWEAYCSSYGLERAYETITSQKLRDYQIVELAKKGSREALSAVEMFKEKLVLGLVNLLHILNPEVVVLGGGLIEGLKPLLGDLEKRVRSLAEPLPASCFRLHFSSAGEFLSARGALAYLMAD